MLLALSVTYVYMYMHAHICNQAHIQPKLFVLLSNPVFVILSGTRLGLGFGLQNKKDQGTTKLLMANLDITHLHVYWPLL